MATHQATVTIAWLRVTLPPESPLEQEIAVY
jgi:hypothetical protein